MPFDVTQDTTPRVVLPPEVLDRIIESLRGLRYGSLEIVVHDGRVVQVERREKLRFGKP